ncbi:MAG: hypothetical protein HC779_03905 [Phyllobacteriaceae bacterium]|nr:hypothetical protein [Phyllobacteriaceae bacterium]
MKTAAAAIGVDGCPGGYVSARRAGMDIVFAVHADFAGLVAGCDVGSVIAIDMPIGCRPYQSRRARAGASGAHPSG